VVLDVGALLGSLAGQSEPNVRAALTLADGMAPCVLFADEIEKALAGATSSGETDSGVTARVFGSLPTWQNDHEPVMEPAPLALESRWLVRVRPACEAASRDSRRRPARREPSCRWRARGRGRTRGGRRHSCCPRKTRIGPPRTKSCRHWRRLTIDCPCQTPSRCGASSKRNCPTGG
jgi:hypothetical protein